VALTPDEWLARFASLPLLEQPGTAWRYNTGATVAGVLIERVAGAPLADVLEDVIFRPLGMVDTGFFVPASKLDRLTTFYRPHGETGALEVLDQPPGWWSEPPTLPDASAALVSTVDDLWRFTTMLAGGGGNTITADSVAEMTRDRMTAEERAANPWFVGDHSGWGLMMSVPAGDGSTGVPGGYGWEGGSGTTWRTDPATGLTAILLTQRMVTSPMPTELVTDFWGAAYGAIDR
jgi:CubicO group peptidase (beta-lactamase class C family)